MTRPTQTKGQQEQSIMTEFFIWLGRNMVLAVILIVLLVGGIIAFLIQGMSWSKVVTEVEKPKWTDKDRQASRYSQGDCVKDPHCRQLKRIFDEGGASQEAIRKNLLAADKTLTFEQIQANAARYEGTPWAFEGKIIDIIGQDKRGVGDYILADIIIGEDPGKQFSVRGDFSTDFAENDYVYVVGYITGTSHPRFGPSNPKYKGNVPSLSARALLKPADARDLQNKIGAN